MNDVLSAIGTAVIEAGVIGVFLWWAFRQGIEGRISKLLENHKAQLAKSLEEHKVQLASGLHKGNKVFERIDQKRAESLLAVDAAIGECRWLLLDFSPKFTFKLEADAGLDAVSWCFQFQERAKNALECTMRNSLLLPEELEKELLGWYFATQTLAQRLFGAFLEICSADGFKNLQDAEKRARFVHAKDSLIGAQGDWRNYGKATRELQG